MNAFLRSLSHWSIGEKLQLVKDLWDDIADEKKLPTSAAARAEVMRRAQLRECHRGQGKTLDRQVPYSLHFRIEVQRIRVLACIHHSRHPQRWPEA